MISNRSSSLLKANLALSYHTAVLVQPTIDFASRSKSPKSAKSKKISNDLQVSKSTARVLYVEDNEIVRKAYQFFLTKMGYEVDVVTNGQELLAKYHANQYDLIILDGGLPDTTGFELGKYIRNDEKQKHKPRIPLLLLSAYPAEEVETECRRVDIDAFLIKPIEYQAFQQQVKYWLEKSFAESA